MDETQRKNLTHALSALRNKADHLIDSINYRSESGRDVNMRYNVESLEELKNMADGIFDAYIEMIGAPALLELIGERASTLSASRR